ncbi:H+-transporting ATPase [Patescibacteria group bacterium]|nr:H+-transporting ATPase [Patescibacteria group bacterium]
MKLSTINVPVIGMACASCAITIQNTLKKADGVVECDVNYGNEKAKIKFDPTKTTIQDLSKKIEKLGYRLANIEQPANHLGKHIMPDGTVMEDSAMDINGIDHSAHLGLNQSKEDKLKELANQKRKVMVSLPVALFTFAVMIWDILSKNFGLPMLPIPESLMQKLLLIVAAVILFWVGGEFLKEVWIFIKYRAANMYTLIGIGTLTAFIYSTIVTLFTEIREVLNLPEHVYFDVTIVVIGFVYLGKYLETRSKLQTSEAIEKLLSLQAKTAIVERDGKEIEIKIEEVIVGDIIIVKPGSKIAVDGEIIEGSSAVDESMITGEAIPVDKTVGDLIIGGTINKQGSLKFKATKIGQATLLAQIITMVDEAQGSKAPIQGLADKVSSVFVPLVLIIAVITLVAWLVIGSNFMPFSESLSFGLLCFTGVLIIACPCALGLATPTAIIVGTGQGAQNGILIKDAESLEKLSKVKVIVTDKTGTITKGEPEVTDILVVDDSKSEKDLLKIISSLEKYSEHPLAKAIINKSQGENIELDQVEDFSIIEGKGLKGKINNEQYFAGNLKLVEDLDLKFEKTLIEQLISDGKTPVILMSSKKILAILGLADTLKPNAVTTIKALHKLGLKVVMLTGDNLEVANYIAKQAGIDQVIAEVLPNQKAEKIKQLQSEGNIVAMVGDGVNDAPALAQADIGIAMSTGTDVAIESASITLLKGDFSKVLQAIKLSKFTLKAIKQNLFWAFAYNIVGIPLATGILYPLFGILLNPAFAGLAMALSSVSVVSNSLRLKYSKL